MMEQGNTARRGPDGTPKNLSDRVRSLRLNDRDAQRAPRSSYLPWIVSFVLLLTTIAFAYRGYRVGALSSGSGSTADHKSDTVATSSTNVAAAGEVVLQAKGYVTPISLVQVSPKVGGQVIWINHRFREGERFTAGEPLAEIESVDYKADLDQAMFTYRMAFERFREAERTLPEELKQAEYDLEEAQQTAVQMKLDMERNKRLTTGNAVAQRDMELAKFGYEAMASRVRRLESAMRLVKLGKLEQRVRAADYDAKQAEAYAEKAKWRYDNTWLVAPISGTVLTKKAELWNIVNPAAYSSGISPSLCEMANLRELEIDLSIQERDVANVFKGQKCLVMPEAYQNDKGFLASHPRGYMGEVSRLMPMADRAKGAVPVRVLILDIPESEDGKYLRPEMGALVSFLRTSEAKPDGRQPAQAALLEGIKPLGAKPARQAYENKKK
jgi:multidrug resistance efflux pump